MPDLDSSVSRDSDATAASLSLQLFRFSNQRLKVFLFLFSLKYQCLFNNNNNRCCCSSISTRVTNKNQPDPHKLINLKLILISKVPLLQEMTKYC